MDAETAASDSALSELNSEEIESVGIAQRSRSRSHSIMSASSDLSSAAASPRASDVPPAKRRKTGAAAYDPATPLSEAAGPPPRSPTGSISSDTSGSVPNSPSFAHLGPTHPLFAAHAAASANPDNPDSADYTQVTRCLWEDCDQPDQGNMDNLVQHIKSVHVVPRQKKYFCQWQGCNRKGQPHTSAYALNAHMRSHTKEKPFFCTLPECDRSFTRSDALAKHMRTVHETEALRPSDPVPRGHTGGISNGKELGTNSGGGIKRIKLIMGGGGSNSSGGTTGSAGTASSSLAAAANGEKRFAFLGDLPPLPTKYTLQQLGIDTDQDVIMRGTDLGDAERQQREHDEDDPVDAVDMDRIVFQLPTTAEYWPRAVWEDMDEYERNLPPSQLFELLRRQIYWAESDGRRLTEELVRLRSTAEDVHGKRLIRGGAGDEKSSESNRAFEWQQTELLLDALLAAGIKKTTEAVTSSATTAGAGAGGEHGHDDIPNNDDNDEHNDDGDGAGNNKSKNRDLDLDDDTINNPWNKLTQLDKLVSSKTAPPAPPPPPTAGAGTDAADADPDATTTTTTTTTGNAVKAENNIENDHSSNDNSNDNKDNNVTTTNNNKDTTDDTPVNKSGDTKNDDDNNNTNHDTSS